MSLTCTGVLLLATLPGRWVYAFVHMDHNSRWPFELAGHQHARYAVLGTKRNALEAAPAFVRLPATYCNMYVNVWRTGKPIANFAHFTANLFILKQSYTEIHSNTQWWPR